jgi:hypothetical protein
VLLGQRVDFAWKRREKPEQTLIQRLERAIAKTCVRGFREHCVCDELDSV